MNVYDFDGTIYKGDSSVDLFFYALRKRPIISLLFIEYGIAVILYKLKIINKTRLKEHLNKYLTFFKNDEIDNLLNEFWDSHKCNIFKYYENQKKPDDVIISASPEFSLSIICKNLGIKTLIASKVNKYTGRYDGNNCHDVEKVSRFLNVYPELKNIEKPIDEFYSDSLSDTPLALISKKAFLIDKNGDRREWNVSKGNLKKKIRE